MSITITQTKISTPRRRPDLISRGRLLKMLDDVLDYKLTLVSAPAGYGKTSLLVDLAHQANYPVCWLSLDRFDRDLLRFSSYFIAALRKQFPAFGQNSLALVNNIGNDEIPLQSLVRTIVNDLYSNISEHFVFILDDYHLVDSNPDLNHFISRLAHEMDENLHLVIASRTLLSLPDLPLLVGRAHVKGISFDELAFQPDEIKALLKQNYNQRISDQESQRLAGESEGWITGLLLSAETAWEGLVDRGRAAKVSGVDLYNYLAQQVLHQQPEEIIHFLLRASFLEEFNADLCQLAIGDSPPGWSWEKIISHLHHNNLFVQPLESGDTWLRFHHLFRDFLQEYFFKIQADQANQYLNHLAQIFSSKTWWERAYSVSRKLNSPEKTADLIERASTDLMHSGRGRILSDWIDQLPKNVLTKYPLLQGYRAVVAAISGDPNHSINLLQQALTQTDLTDQPAIRARLLTWKATSLRITGCYQDALDHAREALKFSANTASQPEIEAAASREMALILRRTGEGEQPQQYLERALDLYEKIEDSQNAAFVMMDLGVIAMEKGNYQEARALFQEVFTIWKDLSNYTKLSEVSNNLGVLAHNSGNFAEALRWFRESGQSAEKTGNLRAKAYSFASLGDLALDLSALSTAESYIQQSLEIAQEISDHFLELYLQITSASLARQAGNLKASRQFLQKSKASILKNPHNFEAGLWHLEHGNFHLQKDNIPEALNAYESAAAVFEQNKAQVQLGISYFELALVHSQAGNQKTAEEYLSKTSEIFDDLPSIVPLFAAASRADQQFTSLEPRFTEMPPLSDLTNQHASFENQRQNLIQELGFEAKVSDLQMIPAIEISALGRIRVKLHGQVVQSPEWTNQKTVRELFFFLLSQPGGASREEICLVFWPESPPEKLTTKFKNAVYRLRKAIGKDAVLYHQPTRLYHFNRDLHYVYDVEAFTRAVKQADGETHLSGRLESLRKAVRLYQHPFAPRIDSTWAEPIRYSLYRDYEKSILLLTDDLLSIRQYREAQDHLSDLLEIVPSQENAWRLMMKIYHAQGDRSGIQRTYRQCQQALQQDLNTDPSPETIDLFQTLMD